MDGSVLAVSAAYENNLVTSKMMTSQVTKRPKNKTLGGKELDLTLKGIEQQFSPF